MVRADRHDRAADRGPGVPGPRRLADDAADDGDHHPDLPGRPRAARRWRCGARRPAWPRWSARSSAACWSTPSGWEWIFFINVPVGVVGFVLAWRLVPTLADPHAPVRLARRRAERGRHVPAGVRHPGGPAATTGARSPGRSRCWLLIVAGLVVFAAVRALAGPQPREPLVPLRLFRDRNFSLANVGITTVGFAITAMAFPLMLYAQLVRGLSPTQSALLLVPMAVVTDRAGALRRQADRPGAPAATSTGGRRSPLTVVSLVWLSRVMTPDARPGRSCCPMALLGLGSACVWAPLSATATRNLPMHDGGCRRGRLQRHPAGRRGARRGRDRRADGLAGSPPTCPALAVGSATGGDRRRAAPGRAARARSARRWRSRCCCRPRSC